MSKFVSPFIKLMSVKGKRCTIRVDHISLVIATEYNECKVYIQGDEIGLGVCRSADSVMEDINSKLKEIKDNEKLSTSDSSFKPFLG